MIEKDKLIQVRNRDNGTVGYTIPDLGNLHRSFQSEEVKEVTMEELRKLSYLPGGEYLLKNCLVIGDKEAVRELISDIEPEYFYTDKEVKGLLISGSLEQLLDALDYAPAGVIELIKKYAVELEINDIQKRNAILKATGFNVTNAIEINHLTSEEKPKETKQERRVQTTETEENLKEKRRAELPKYDIVTPKVETLD